MGLCRQCGHHYISSWPTISTAHRRIKKTQIPSQTSEPFNGKNLFLVLPNLLYLGCNKTKIQQLKIKNRKTMKKILSTALIALLFFRCQTTDPQSETNSQAQIDSLQQIINNSQNTMNEYFSAIAEIESNLETIKDKEKILTANKGDNQSKDIISKINQDVLAIYELLKTNQRKLAELQSKNQRSGMKIMELNNVVEKLQSRLSEKTDEISALKTRLSGMNLIIDSLYEGIDSIMLSMAIKDEIMEYQDYELSKAFYVIGTKKELIEKEVLTKQGLFAGLQKIKQLKTDFNKNYFTEININRFKSVALFAEEAELITNHPTNSYKLIKTEKIDSLKITDINNFWSVSKYLVIVIEN